MSQGLRCGMGAGCAPGTTLGAITPSMKRFQPGASDSALGWLLDNSSVLWLDWAVNLPASPTLVRGERSLRGGAYTVSWC